ncbi:NAD(P)/FAD-dependent oxidoreductase [Roseomonas haemaphysalidis]|uniref:FAD-binding oxidoreductase n=1 Tax=Roseomonas haemaphysalidis TaxID=2768162 RepID=A0ABS3KUV0_9PROT|nr:FAD-binding oxidoreductase [Roseomonas haemaphysalidis]MBO1081247.1 FAD-binding oxidoreductase [Roseomonas haemaphysalidis]
MNRHVAVIGAGIEGAASAIELLRAGHRVTILEPGMPGGEQAASYGNAGWLSSHSVLPPSGPGLWKQVPGFIADPLGPLAIRWPHLPRSAPWLLRYLAAGWTEERVRGIAAALRPLLKDSPVLHGALAREAGVPGLIEHKGLMNAWHARAGFEGEAMGWRIRRQLGISWTEVEGAALRDMEPDLDPAYTFAVLTEEAGRCLAPGRYIAALVAHAQRGGAALRPVAASGLRLEGESLRGVALADGSMLDCDAAVICCGIRSAPLAAQAGDRVPLQTERGYHVMLQGASVGPRHSVSLGAAKMVVNSMQDGLRTAGQVEIAATDAPPDWRRAEILRDHLLRSFPGLPRPFPEERVKLWMGHRPSTPDGLPCLGPSRRSPHVVHAFGHGHVGLVAGARTGRLVAQLLSGQPPEIPLAPFSAARFR